MIEECHLCDGDLTPSAKKRSSSRVLPGSNRILWFRLMLRSRNARGELKMRPSPTRASLRALHHSFPKWNRDTLVLIDGWEQIRWPSRLWIHWSIKRSGAKLLLTSHHPTHLPTLWNSSVCPEIAQCVIRDLLQSKDATATTTIPRDWETKVCDTAQLQQYLNENHGSLREVLFKLYDEFEHTCRSDPEKRS